MFVDAGCTCTTDTNAPPHTVHNKYAEPDVLYISLLYKSGELDALQGNVAELETSCLRVLQCLQLQ